MPDDFMTLVGSENPSACSKCRRFVNFKNIAKKNPIRCAKCAEIERCDELFGEPAREVVRKNPVRVVGWHASRKMRCLIGWESQLEKKHLEWLEVDPDVLAFYAQPSTIRTRLGRYTPDAYVVTRTNSYFAEVKPDKVYHDDDEMERIRGLQRHFRLNGHELRLITSQTLLANPLRANVERLMREVRRSLPQACYETGVYPFEDGLTTFEKILNSDDYPYGEAEIFRAIAHGHLWIDLTQTISATSTVRILAEENTHA
ncbi:hypothetical protein [Kordiimonas sp. SCSIO 12610]|uniref:hypothetical protein n=1 Tax=Kordiimonas sp. SCSIO 12610 TaxID=2829597 RepID=UPI002108F36F|nr:hypothetical protein [Kordiimonas sp. SCSIO 12610]UTW54823.1 hypothetical protein KFF44_13565 [Kordiimonas sp. SCSIO 12610]